VGREGKERSLGWDCLFVRSEEDRQVAGVREEEEERVGAVSRGNWVSRKENEGLGELWKEVEGESIFALGGHGARDAFRAVALRKERVW
jgi:hypothetical protein